jgi:hypothetical protein
LKRLVWFTLPILVLALIAPSSVVATAAPTLPQLDTVAKQIDVSAAAGAISTGIAMSLKAKIAAAGKAIARGDATTADRIIDAFLKEVEAQSGRGIAASAADLLAGSAAGSGPPSVIAVPVGVATIVATQIGSNPVLLALPSGSNVAWIRFGAAANASVPLSPASSRLISIAISAYDSFGAPVTQLGGAARLSIGFQPAASVDTRSARIATVTSTGALEALPTEVTEADDALTATALTTHLSPFVLDALTTDPPWRFTYVTPPTITGITPSTGSMCGGTTVVVTGSGFSGDIIPAVSGTVVQSFTIDSDTQMTMLTSVPDATDTNAATLSKFLTSTAIAPEFANRIDVVPGSFALNALSGTAYPGTPTYDAVVQPVTPRISAVAPNQGPTIGAPAHPGQDFANPAIRITGCGFSGATAVLFGLTPSPSFTVQHDAIILAVPPTPGSGTVDIRVVTPLGTSPIVP